MSKDTPTALSKAAVSIAAKNTGLRPDQIERAIAEYRRACDETDADYEPDWRAVYHVSGKGMNQHLYAAEGTKITLTINCYGRELEKQEKVYGYNGKAFESFAEARAIELEEAARPKPYVVHGTGKQRDGGR